MNKITLSIIALSFIAITGLTVGIMMKQDQTEFLSATGVSTYLPFYTNEEIDNFQLDLIGLRDEEQLSKISAFAATNAKFFTGVQIIKLLLPLQAKTYDSQYNPSRNNAIFAIKPYIGPLTTAEALQVFKVLDASDGLASGVIISQIYDLYNNQENIGNLSSAVAGYYQIQRNQVLLPQSTKQFQYNFLITTEGDHVGFLIDQSGSMASIAQTNPDGTNVTRYDLLKKYYYNRFDIFQSFRAFSYQLINNQYSLECKSCSTGSYEQAKALNSYVQNILKPDGQKDLYLRLSFVLSDTNNQLSDLNIWTDGIIDAGTKNVDDFIQLINKSNEARRNKIRINVTSFLVGGNESQTDKDSAITLMKTLASYTNGTFIQVNPQQQ